MKTKILITGSEGLIGEALGRSLLSRGHEVVGLDIRAKKQNFHGDVLDEPRVEGLLRGVDGVVHLAAVSRVITGEREPERCRRTNLDGLATVLRVACRQETPPWFIFASSREVYGEPGSLPVAEDRPLAPVNLYGQTKVEGEKMVMASGLCSAVVRLSNVFGGANDHPDRVVPAFVLAALRGQPLRIEGPDNTFDFTHLDDTVDGLLRVVDLLHTRRNSLPPVHLLPGKPTSLLELARSALAVTGSSSPLKIEAPRRFDVSHFYGDPTLARELLGWSARISLTEGLSRLAALLQQTSLEGQP